MLVAGARFSMLANGVMVSILKVFAPSSTITSNTGNCFLCVIMCYDTMLDCMVVVSLA